MSSAPAAKKMNDGAAHDVEQKEVRVACPALLLRLEMDVLLTLLFAMHVFDGAVLSDCASDPLQTGCAQDRGAVLPLVRSPLHTLVANVC